MGIGWVQLGEEETWPEEEIALGLNGWPSATIAEIVAIWSAILTVPKGCTVVICTDSYAAIRNISRALQHVDIDQTLKRKNARWIMSIVGLVRSKNIRLEFRKVKSHSEDKWNDRADHLAKKGAKCKEKICTKGIKYDEIEYRLEWENKRTDIPTRLLCKIIAYSKIGAMWRDTNAIRDIEPETDTVVYNWGAFWKEMNRTRGVHCTTRKISARRAAAIKCIMNRLPTMEKLNKRKPEIYEVTECQVCKSGNKET